VSSLAGATDTTTRSSPRWVLHVKHYPGGISNGVRSSLDAADAAVAPANVLYPVWVDGRNTAIASTGIGNTDIFTNVAP
jgi:hypothetical protein